MDPTNTNAHLSQIMTLWSVVCQAHRGPAEAQAAARERLMERYGGAVIRYLTRSLRNPDAAQDLYQEFALRFISGKFQGASPERGRFRDYLKTALYHLIVDYKHKQHGQPRLLSSSIAEPAAESTGLSDAERAFTESWREELLAHAWDRLSACERETGQPFYTVLRLRADQPDLRSPQMAEQLSARLGKPITSNNVRQLLHRAREKFADILLDEVTQSLENATPDELEQELGDLGLLEYCRPALERRAGSGTGG
jgi:RNA polymerase sigma-70 factor (ECF subfamily)